MGENDWIGLKAMEAGMSKDQQKGEKFNKGHFVVEQIKIELNFLLTLFLLFHIGSYWMPPKCKGKNEEMQAIWETFPTKVF